METVWKKEDQEAACGGGKQKMTPQKQGTELALTPASLLKHDFSWISNAVSLPWSWKSAWEEALVSQAFWCSKKKKATPSLHCFSLSNQAASLSQAPLQKLQVPMDFSVLCCMMLPVSSAWGFTVKLGKMCGGKESKRRQSNFYTVPIMCCELQGNNRHQKIHSSLSEVFLSGNYSQLHFASFFLLYEDPVLSYWL